MTQKFHSTPSYIPGKIKTHVHTKTCTEMFITASFIIPKSGKNMNVYQLMNNK